MTEQWLEVEGFPGYWVSSLGNVRGLRGDILNTIIINSGYKSLQLCADKVAYRKTIHRLVAQAFLPNPDNKEMVDHINGNKHDNRVENLRWATRSENCKNIKMTEMRYIKKQQNRFAYRRNDKCVWFGSLEEAQAYRDSVI